MSGSRFFVNKTPPNTKKLDQAGSLANRFINEKIETYLDELEHMLTNAKGERVWARDAAKKVLGRQLALAYAFGYMDRTENRS